MNTLDPNTVWTCSFEGCTGIIIAKKLCRAHYTQQRRGKELTPTREMIKFEASNITAVEPKKVGGKLVCAFEGCGREYKSRGYCDVHYRQLHRGAKLTPIGEAHKYKEKKAPAICKLDDCDTKAVSRRKGYCAKHYNRLVLGTEARGTTKFCKFTGCEKVHYAKGYCLNHYRKFESPTNKKTCTLDGCSKPHVARGLCSPHYYQAKQRGDFTDIRYRAKSGRTDEEFKKYLIDNVTVDERSGCWIWQGALRDQSGDDPYGQMAYKGRPIQVHRVAYDLFNGGLEDTLVIDHICHTTLCCNPKHLRQVTQEENMKHRKTTVIANGGVYYLEDSDRWSSFDLTEEKFQFIGIFPTEQEAREAQPQDSGQQAA